MQHSNLWKNIRISCLHLEQEVDSILLCTFNVYFKVQYTNTLSQHKILTVILDYAWCCLHGLSMQLFWLNIDDQKETAYLNGSQQSPNSHLYWLPSLC